MADIYITEYSRLGRDLTGHIIAAGMEPAVAQQKIANPVASTQSAALNAQTAFVMVHVSAAAHILFGTDPTATTDSPRLAAGETRFYAVHPGSAMEIAAINGA